MRFRLMIAAAALFLATPLQAHEFTIGTIAIDHPWSRPTPPGAPVASGYIKLVNSGSEADRLIEVISPISKRVEIHRSIIEDGVAKMRQVEGGLVIEPGKTVDFGQEKLHLMFIEPTQQLKDKERFPATLVFEKGGRVDVEFAVQRTPGEPMPDDHSAHGG